MSGNGALFALRPAATTVHCEHWQADRLPSRSGVTALRPQARSTRRWRTSPWRWAAPCVAWSGSGRRRRHRGIALLERQSLRAMRLGAEAGLVGRGFADGAVGPARFKVMSEAWSPRA